MTTTTMTDCYYDYCYHCYYDYCYYDYYYHYDYQGRTITSSHHGVEKRRSSRCVSV